MQYSEALLILELIGKLHCQSIIQSEETEINFTVIVCPKSIEGNVLGSFIRDGVFGMCHE